MKYLLSNDTQKKIVYIPLILQLENSAKVQVPFDSAVPFLGIFPKELRASYYGVKYACLCLLIAKNSPNACQLVKEYRFVLIQWLTKP